MKDFLRIPPNELKTLQIIKAELAKIEKSKIFPIKPATVHLQGYKQGWIECLHKVEKLVDEMLDATD